MGSRIGGAAVGDLTGASAALSENGYVLVASSNGADSGRGSVTVYVWTSGDWEQPGGVLAGPLPGRQFRGFTSLRNDGTVVAVGSQFRSGVRVFDLTVELDNAGCVH